jgi:hypothetical protein
LALFINVEKNNYSRVSGTREHRSRVKWTWVGEVLETQV